jgi:Na+-driven multidrug efflux pump
VPALRGHFSQGVYVEILIYYLIVAFSFALSTFISIVLPANKITWEISEEPSILDNAPISFTTIWLILFTLAFPIVLLVFFRNVTRAKNSIAIRLITDEKLQNEILKELDSND